MGATASFTSLSAEELGAGVAGLGAAYKSLQKEIEESGITGKILFEEVKDEDAAFKKFIADNLGVTKPLQQTVLLSNYIERLRADGDGNNATATATVQFDVRDTVQRSPKDILSQLFQIQGIPLDPDNVAAATDKIAAAVTAAVGEGAHAACDGETVFDCFISYRVAADKDIAEKLYDKLTIKGLFPFLDKVKLKDGMAWKDGFLQGLKGSKCFVSLISRKALEPCRDKTRNHTWDNVLLEIETALRYKNASGNASYIIPVFVGEIVTFEGAQMLRKFADFGGGMYADTIEGAAAPAAVVAAAAVAPAAPPARDLSTCEGAMAALTASPLGPADAAAALQAVGTLSGTGADAERNRELFKSLGACEAVAKALATLSSRLCGCALLPCCRRCCDVPVVFLGSSARRLFVPRPLVRLAPRVLCFVIGYWPVCILAGSTRRWSCCNKSKFLSEF